MADFPAETSDHVEAVLDRFHLARFGFGQRRKQPTVVGGTCDVEINSKHWHAVEFW